MTTAHTLRRSLTISLVALGLALTTIATAAAESSEIPKDAVIVSSTDLSGAFTMTASNIGDDSMDLDLPAPGAASDVSVDMGTYDGTWSIDSLGSGETATMTGTIAP